MNLKFRVWDKKNSRFLKYWDDNTSLDLWRWAELMSTCLIFPINDYIIQQYTGMKDSCGVEVYEGDIVEKDNQTAEVFWHDAIGGFDLADEFGYPFSTRNLLIMKVVGHINAI